MTDVSYGDAGDSIEGEWGRLAILLRPALLPMILVYAYFMTTIRRVSEKSSARS